MKSDDILIIRIYYHTHTYLRPRWVPPPVLNSLECAGMLWSRTSSRGPCGCIALLHHDYTCSRNRAFHRTVSPDCPLSLTLHGSKSRRSLPRRTCCGPASSSSAPRFRRYVIRLSHIEESVKEGTAGFYPMQLPVAGFFSISLIERPFTLRHLLQYISLLNNHWSCQDRLAVRSILTAHAYRSNSPYRVKESHGYFSFRLYGNHAPACPGNV